MRTLYAILGLLVIFSLSAHAECVKKRDLMDWILGEYTLVCSDSYELRVREDDNREDILVRAGLVAAGIFIIWQIYEYGQQPKQNPSLLYYQITHRKPKPIKLIDSLDLEPNLFVGRKIGFGFTLKF
ncbi:MAG: hypothetical protein OXH39_04930 [Candidatus Poribacteria bacterium]|nr:hypothetical protein [Candidatus Poribacteria bacterium]